ncbi:zinc finger, CCHC-type containing protein, partial [Tanacetum coccineum]
SKVTYWKCGKPGHLKKDYKGIKVGNKANGSCTNGLVDGSTNSLKGQNMVNKSLQVYYVTYVSEASFVQDDDVAGGLTQEQLCMCVKIDGSLIKRFGTDRGGEYIDTLYFQSVSIIHETTAPCTPQQNGISKRKNKHSKDFRFYVIEPNESVSINSIIESRDAIFDENGFSLVSRPSLRITIGGLMIPKEVIEEVLADLPLGCKPLGCKWIFKTKLKVDGTIEKFKARLVIQGFRQKSRINYFDTYAPVERISTIRRLIAMASIHNLIIHQMDVKTTFLKGELDEEVDSTKEFLSSRFFMKDMGKADVILGIRIKHESNGIEISQSRC